MRQVMLCWLVCCSAEPSISGAVHSMYRSVWKQNSYCLTLKENLKIASRCKDGFMYRGVTSSIWT